MSRQQWGHGFYSGYDACRNEEQRLGIKKPSDCDIVLAVAKSISHERTYVGLSILKSSLVLDFFDTEKDAIRAIKKCEKNGLCECDDEYFLFNWHDAVEAQKHIDDYCERKRKIEVGEE